MNAGLIIPQDYRPALDVRETEVAIRRIKTYFQDNLAFELCSTENRGQWVPAQRKLASCADAIECWHHTGQMLRAEGEQNRPFGDPMCSETTTIMRQLLRGARHRAHRQLPPEQLVDERAADASSRTEHDLQSLVHTYCHVLPVQA